MPKGRRVRRVVRKIDTWTVLRLSFVFWLCVALIGLVAAVLLWALAGRFDVFNSVSKFLESLGILDFRFHGGVIFKAAALIAMVLVLLATGASVLLAVLYNLISDVVGGVELVVLEEEPDRPAVRPVSSQSSRATAGEASSAVGPAAEVAPQAVASSNGDDGYAPEVALG